MKLQTAIRAGELADAMLARTKAEELAFDALQLDEDESALADFDAARTSLFEAERDLADFEDV